MKIEEVYSFYDLRIAAHSAVLQKLRTAVHNIGTARLLLIVVMFVILWLCRNENVWALVAIAAAFLLPFLFLVVYHSRLFAKCAYEEEFLRLNKNERKALDYDFSAFDGAKEEADSQHSFSLDLDLFGEKSLFQSINRTVTEDGRQILLDWFKRPLDSKNEILRRQESVRELCELYEFRQDFYVTGKDNPKMPKDISLSFLKNFNAAQRQNFSNSVMWRIMMWAVPVIWIVLIVGCIFNIFNVSFIGIYAVASFAISNIPSKRIQAIYKSVDKTEKILKKYSQLIEKIEQQKFYSELLQNYQQKLYRSIDTNTKSSASKAIKKLSRHIGALDQRYSTVGIILNILYLRDIRQSILLEQWQKAYSEDSIKWFKTVGIFDAFCSLGGFAFNHPDYVYPCVSDKYFEIKGEGLGHPLLNRDMCVRNNVDIPSENFFLIITGANMAGKSTFLRTVGVNFMLACIGAPVYAETFTFYPAHLVTSLRTTDSLASNESYFLAELKRLKMIIDRLEAGEKLFIILDEILKGTNSADKQKGSFGLMKKLIRKKTCGIIATHDLLLGSLAETFPENIRNNCFEADIYEDKLVFSYKLRNGVAQNMNATFLMRKMGILDE